MQGEFRADVMRNSFDEKDRLHRVVFQSGRVLLESDLNRMVSILLHRFERSIEDLIGPHGGNGFQITVGGNNTLMIGKGRYYVHGILCENEKLCPITEQPDYKFDHSGKNGDYLLYLDVFETHAAGRPEVELQGIGTVAEAKVVWQVKALAVEALPEKTLNSLAEINPASDKRSEEDRWALINMVQDDLNIGPAATAFEESVKTIPRPLMGARANPVAQASSPCIIPADSRFRGLDRQFYRVEIDQSGYAKPSGKKPVATFKWSRENSSLTYPLVGLPITDEVQTVVTVEHLGRDAKLGLAVGNWVELTDEEEHRYSIPGQLMQILGIDRELLHITLRGKWESESVVNDQARKILRRWDHQWNGEGGIPIGVEWVPLENGAEVQFKSDAVGEAHYYQKRMYWSFVANPSLGNIEWLVEENNPENPLFQEPHGVTHYYAPLAFVKWPVDGVKDIKLLRKQISSVAT